MPQGDGTGPDGMGPMTGRGAGFCAGFDLPGYANRAFCRGRGFRGGMGRRRMAFVEPKPLSKEEEVKSLEQEQKILKQEMDYIEKKLKELKNR